MKKPEWLKKPKWLRPGSWVVHAILLVTVITITIFVLNYLADRGIVSQQTQNAANVALNWCAMAYAVYAYRLYDTSRQAAVDKLEEGGIKVVSLEEGISTIIKEFQPFTEWFSQNREALMKMAEKAKELDLGKMVVMFDELEKMVDTLKKTGYTKENLEKSLDAFVRLTKMMEQIDGKDPKKLEAWFSSLVNIASRFEKVDPKKIEKWFDILFETLGREDAIERAKTLTEAPVDDFLNIGGKNE